MLRVDKIPALMAQANIASQRELAERMGVPGPQISRMIRNQRPHGITLFTLQRLCLALRCQPADILDRITF